MNHDVRLLFREVAGLSHASRENEYARRRISGTVRAELESLLNFDQAPDGSLGDVVGFAAEQMLLSNAPVSEGGRCGAYRLIRLLGNGGMGIGVPG
jgi:hypothetical protein